jgi:mono/diheme cytochrome c family protein
MFRRSWFALASVLIMLGLITGVAFAQAGDVERGKTLWTEVKLCKNCHGANGEGLYAGPRAGDGKSLEQWITQVRTPRANMPHFNDVQVSDQEIADMWEYMQSLPKPASFTPKVYTPDPNDHPGLVLVNQERCVACHGDYKQTLQFRFVARNRTVIDAAAVIKQLRTPAQNMPAFSAEQVSDEQAAQIAEYLQTQLDALLVASKAPTTLPVSGGEQPISPWPIIMIVVGLAMLGVGALPIARRKA